MKNILIILLLLLSKQISAQPSAKSDSISATNNKIKGSFIIEPLVPTVFTLLPTHILGITHLNQEGILFLADSTQGRGLTKILKLNRYYYLAPQIEINWKDVASVKRGYELLVIPRRVKIKMQSGKKYRFDVNYNAGKFKKAFKNYQFTQTKE